MNEIQRSQFLIYQSEDGRIKLDVRFQNDTVWLTQAMMAELFGVAVQNITIHIKNVYDEGELTLEATCKEFLQVQEEGGRSVSRNRKFYNLDLIISVGYRIKSKVATQFRIWATQHLSEFIPSVTEMYYHIKPQRGDSGNYFESQVSGSNSYKCGAEPKDMAWHERIGFPANFFGQIGPFRQVGRRALHGQVRDLRKG